MYRIQQTDLVEYENDPADFKVPYRWHGVTERELMRQRYDKLQPRSNPQCVYYDLRFVLSVQE